MPENESLIDKSIAFVINPETNKSIGRISLVGNPVPATKWINASGPLQGFIIVDGRELIRDAWSYQHEVLLQTYIGQRTIKIVTYPTEGEDQGYLDFTSELEVSPKIQAERKNRLLSKRGFAFLQSLFST